jgi:uncharacterized protein (TIGR00725 family)
MERLKMHISIFGGSYPKPGIQAYDEAYKLGRLLGQAGHTILTGGYIGTMEAVSRGASETGAHVIGVTCADIEKWRPIKANAWVGEERKFESLQDRLKELILKCDVAIALPGGPGTLAEIALTWNLMIVNSIPEKPLILIGDGWRSTMDVFFESFDEYIPMTNRKFLSFAKGIEEAFSLLPKLIGP